MQRSRECVVEQHELQQLPPSAMLVTYSAPGGRQVVAVDANPAIMSLPTATLASLEEARRIAQESIGQAPGRDAGPVPSQPDLSQPDPGRVERSARHPDGPPRPRDGADPPPAGRRSLSWRDRAEQLPPNLGPPPERLDWRRRPDR